MGAVRFSPKGLIYAKNARNKYSDMYSDHILSNEIRGDLSVVKGTEYHLVYALWLLISGQASEVAFYEGNDLLAHPIPPPLLTGEDESLPAVPIHVNDGQEDIWVQLKSSSKEWTVSMMLDCNLLFNFLCNAIVSQQNGKKWQAKLITQGLVQQRKIKDFISNPSKHSKHLGKLKTIITEVQNQIKSRNISSSVFDEDVLLALGLSILKQLALTVPMRIETLTAQIKLELAYAYPDREAAKQIADSLLGRILHDAGGGPSAARTYDIEWLNQAAGLPIKNRGLLDINPLAACLEVSKRSLPREWNGAHYLTRSRLENALNQFLKSRETAFVLVGMSGTGKSWAVSDFMIRVLDGRVRLLIPGSDLDYHKTLDAIVAGRLRQQLTKADWRDDVFLRRLKAAATVQSKGPLVFIIDDIIPSGSINIFQRDLARLVESVREIGAKIILTCQKHTWQLHNLSSYIPGHDIFSLDKEAFTLQKNLGNRLQEDQNQENQGSELSLDNAESSDGPKGFSFSLPDLQIDEIAELLKKQFPSSRAEEVANQLRAPVFAALRNPYLLRLYLEQHSKGLNDPVRIMNPVGIDSLLDFRVKQALDGITRIIACSSGDTRSAFDRLLDKLWIIRPGGLSYDQAYDCLYQVLRDKGPLTLDELRRVGLLTTEGPIRLQEPLIADRLFAKCLNEDSRSIDDLSNELRVEYDPGVALALMRGNLIDPIQLAESLLNGEPRWRKAITEGLAQGSSEDYRSLALLSVLSRPRSRSILNFDACDALGQLAARGQRAWKWVAEMYLCDDHDECSRGARALLAAMEFNPRKVEAAVRLQFYKASKVPELFSSDREKRQQYLRAAMDPLTGINHKGAVEVGRRIIQKYSHLARRDRDRINYRFLESIDEIRGRIAIYGEESDLQTLLDELRSEEMLSRYRAAVALRTVTYDEPERVEGPLVEAIKVERDESVLTRLIWCAYRLIETAPDTLLDGLEANPVTLWQERSLSAAPVLALLGNLADRRPDRVIRLLPTDIYPNESDDRAYLSEMFAYAWWRCAQYMPAVRPILTRLKEPDLQNVSEEFRPFAFRGAAIAQLGAICLDTVPSSELAERNIMMFTSLSYHFLYTDEIVNRHAAALLSHTEYENLQQLLLKCLEEESHINLHPAKHLLGDVLYHCTSLCLEMLIAFASILPDPLPILASLPQAWQKLRAAWRLLDSGKKDQSVIDFAQQTCDEYAHNIPIQAMEEREHCLFELAKLESQPRAAIELNQMRVENPSHLLFDSDRPARTLAKVTDSDPKTILSMLDDTIRTEEHLLTLYYWQRETRCWQSLLIARVYARMFDPRPIRIGEAKDLCDQMLSAVTALPDSPLRQQYETVYKVIKIWLSGGKQAPPDLASIEKQPHSALQESHVFAFSLFQRELEVKNCVEGDTQVVEVIEDRRGWWETYDFEIDNRSVSHGRAAYTIYFFPAARLTLIAIGRAYKLNDPATQFMRQRIEVNKLYKKHFDAFDSSINISEENIEKALSDISEQTQLFPNDERLWEWRGHLLLRAGRLIEAEQALLRSLSMRTSGASIRASTFYNLACTYARAEREQDCRTALEESVRLRPLNKRWMIEDPDLESLREKAWFKDLLM